MILDDEVILCYLGFELVELLLSFLELFCFFVYDSVVFAGLSFDDLMRLFFQDLAVLVLSENAVNLSEGWSFIWIAGMAPQEQLNNFRADSSLLQLSNREFYLTVSKQYEIVDLGSE